MNEQACFQGLFQLSGESGRLQGWRQHFFFFFCLPSGSQLIRPVSSFGYSKGVVSMSYSLAQTLIRLLSEAFHNSREGCAV